MESKEPLASTVDVVIPTYNGGKFVLAAIRSVDQQTYPPAKIIVVDDGSTDNTEAIVRNYKSSVPVQYVKKENGGLSSARNAGIRAATAEYVAFLDADDVWLPTKLEDQLKVFQKNTFPNLGVVYCQYEIIDESGNISNRYYIFHADPKIRGSVFEKILPKNKVASSGSGVLVKRLCFERSGMFDEQLGAAEDWDCWLRLAEHYAFDYVDKVLVQIRRHGENMQNDSAHMFRNRLRFYDKWIKALPVTMHIPSAWPQAILREVFARLPNLDRYQEYKASLQPAIRKKLSSTLLHSGKIFFFQQLLSLPGTVFRNLSDQQS